MKWKDDNTLYFINIEENRSTLLTYNTNDNEHKQILTIDFKPEEFDFSEKGFIFVQE